MKKSVKHSVLKLSKCIFLPAGGAGAAAAAGGGGGALLTSITIVTLINFADLIKRNPIYALRYALIFARSMKAQYSFS